MANTITSPNMNLPIPVVGQDPGPDYANNINASLTVLDQHNHTPGQGVAIPAAGLNINTDLPFNSNNATLLRSTRYAIQSSLLSLATDIGCLYVSGVDLYYNDASGNQVRLTQSGGVAGSPGSIANLTSPASASYVSANQTFVFQSAANTPGNLDAASIVLRNLAANSKGLTLNPPASMGANYSLNLPALPGSASVLSLDASGNIATGVASTVGTNDLVNASVTPAKLAALNIVTSSSSGNATGNSATFTNVTNLTVTLTTTGRPVYVGLIADGSGSVSSIGVGGSSAPTAVFSIERDFSTSIALAQIQTAVTTGNANINQPPGSLWTIDVPAAGTHSYTLQARLSSGTAWSVSEVKIIAYEL